MDKIKIHAFLAATILIGLVGFYVLLSPPFTELRKAIGLPEHLPGARYNESVGAAEIINPEEGELYLARVTFVYHSVFISLLYATLIVFSNFYLKNDDKWLILDSAAIGAVLTVVGALLYSYYDQNFFWHGVFLVGLSIYFLIGLLLLLRFRPKDLLDWNIWLSGVLLIVGAIMGGWLGASFMFYRDEFLEALIASRFNPDWAEENAFWRALTGHEHAMIAIVLALVFMLALKYVGIDYDKKLFKVFTPKILLIMTLVGQFFTAAGAYAVFFVGGIAHVIITPSALLLIFGTLLLSFMTKENNFISLSLKVGNIIMWVAVAIPGAIVAMSLRKPRFFDPPFRDPVWDYAELAYNIGHWHILLLSWGIILYIIFAFWPINLAEKKLGNIEIGKIALYAILIGYSVASIGINFYMLANPPGAYSPNPYDNIWLMIFVEPGLTIMALGIATIYLFALIEYGKEFYRCLKNRKTS